MPLKRVVAKSFSGAWEDMSRRVVRKWFTLSKVVVVVHAFEGSGSAS